MLSSEAGRGYLGKDVVWLFFVSSLLGCDSLGKSLVRLRGNSVSVRHQQGPPSLPPQNQLRLAPGKEKEKDWL